MLLLVGTFFFVNNYIYQQKQSSQGDVVTSYEAKLTGEFVCLPTTAGDGVLEICTYGVKTNSGEYYSLDFNSESDWSHFRAGKRFSAKGIIDPNESLNADSQDQLRTQGKFTITKMY